MKRWVVNKYNADVERIACRYRVSSAFAEILLKRGLHDWKSMDNYLYPDAEKMYAPEKMKDLEKAGEILRQKIADGKRICIFGDYDVDGIMSACILIRGLKTLGAEVTWRIPHRVRDGYGIRSYMVTEAFENGIDTIVTCDNGISAEEAVQCAVELGMTIIITDHHEVPEEDGNEKIPPADAVVNPKQRDCTYPYRELCGGGVACKLMQYLLGEHPVMKQLRILAGIATICDVVPLKDENRILADYALRHMRESGNIGLDALLAVLDLQRPVTSRDIGFGIGPCLNAAGRLDDAAIGLELLLESDRERARSLAEELWELNEKRKEMTVRATEEAVRKLEQTKLDSVLVIYLENCHESIAGIVAGRIRELYYRPTMILTKAGEKLKGSGRSIPGYHMQEALNRCSRLLTEYGGHAMAAGFSLPPDNLQELRKQLNADCALSEDELTEKVVVDKVLALREADRKLVGELLWLEPTGEGNPPAVFACLGIELCQVRIFGKENQIGRFQIREGEEYFWIVDFDIEKHIKRAVRERYGEAAWECLIQGEAKEMLIDILYRPQINQKYGDIEYQVLESR